MRLWRALGVELLLHEDAHAPERPARGGDAKDVDKKKGGKKAKKQKKTMCEKSGRKVVP